MILFIYVANVVPFHFYQSNHLLQIFSLWAVSDRKYGGLSFSTQDVGVVLAVSGIVIPNVYTN